MILVTGATGNVGRPLVNALRAHGARVRAVTRDAAAADLPDGVEVVQADPTRPDTVAEHLDGVAAVFINSSAVRDSVGELTRLARERGVRRLVGLSAYNIEQHFSLQPSRFLGDRNAETEAAVESSGLEWVSLRPAAFAGPAQIAMWAPQIRAGDVVTGPYAAMADPLIDPRDVGEVAAHALLHDDLLGRKPVLTGPEAVSHHYQVTAIGTALGRPLRYQEISLDKTAENLSALGLPPDLVASFIARWAAIHGRGPEPEVTDEVDKILGRPARTFTTWAKDHAWAFDNHV